MRAEEEGRLEGHDAFVLHIGRCLGCRACETACPAGVPFGTLLEKARERSPCGPGKQLAEWAVLRLLTGRHVAIIYGLLRGLRDSGVAGKLAFLPGRSGLAARLLAATRPAIQPSAIESNARPNDLPTSSEDAHTYVLLEGCVMQGLFAHVHRAVRRVLSRREYAERSFRGQVCCGALHAHAGRLAAARELARRNIEAFERTGAEWLVVDSAGCGAALRGYPDWLRESEEWVERATALAARVRDVSELAIHPPPGRAPERGLRATGDSYAASWSRVAYDAPCHLWHGQGVKEQPVEMMRRTGALLIESLASSEVCCGGAGVYNLFHPDLADAVLQPKLEEIRQGTFDWVATGNPGCIMQLGAGTRKARIAVPVVHPVELLDAVESEAECMTT